MTGTSTGAVGASTGAMGFSTLGTRVTQRHCRPRAENLPPPPPTPESHHYHHRHPHRDPVAATTGIPLPPLGSCRHHRNRPRRIPPLPTSGSHHCHHHRPHRDLVATATGIPLPPLGSRHHRRRRPRQIPPLHTPEGRERERGLRVPPSAARSARRSEIEGGEGDGAGLREREGKREMCSLG